MMQVRHPHSNLRQLTRLAVLLSAVWASDLSTPAYAEVSIPNIFSDHMVLQRNQPNKVWGKAASGEKVTVKIGDQRPRDNR